MTKLRLLVRLFRPVSDDFVQSINKWSLIFSEIDELGLMESRFFCCALTSIAVRLFGGKGHPETVLK